MLTPKYIEDFNAHIASKKERGKKKNMIKKRLNQTDLYFQQPSI